LRPSTKEKRRPIQIVGSRAWQIHFSSIDVRLREGWRTVALGKEFRGQGALETLLERDLVWTKDACVLLQAVELAPKQVHPVQLLIIFFAQLPLALSGFDCVLDLCAKIAIAKVGLPDRVRGAFENYPQSSRTGVVRSWQESVEELE
jgi:hypothetical protein